MRHAHTPSHDADVLNTGFLRAPHGARICNLAQVGPLCMASHNVVMATLASNSVSAYHLAQQKLHNCDTYAIRVGSGCLASVLGVVYNRNVGNTRTVELNRTRLLARLFYSTKRAA